MTMVHRGIRDKVTGHIIRAAGFYEWGAIPGWIHEAVAEHYECDPDDIGSGDDDEITVRGVVVATVESGPQVYGSLG